MLPSLHIGDTVSRLPIVQGGMGICVSLAGLASAVAEQGGIGVISAAVVGINEPDAAAKPQDADKRGLANEIQKARSMTKGVIGVNIMVALTNYAELVKVSSDEGADVIFSGAGLPLDMPKHLGEGSKTKLVPIVSSGRAAAILCKKWQTRFDRLPDAFVVEGPMAGGHLGFKPEQLDDPKFALEKLVPEVVEAVKPYEEQAGRKIPVIAAGGIYTGADIRTFLDLGAAGVQMGTRFVATDECDVSDSFKQAYIQAKEEDMVVVNSPVGLPGRAVRNKFTEDVQAGRKEFKCTRNCIITCDPKKSRYCISNSLIDARDGDVVDGLVFAGKNAYRVDRIVSVKELMETLVREYEEAAGPNKDAALNVNARRSERMDLLTGKKALIFGVANDKSIAYGIAKQFKAHGARLAFSYAGDALKKRVEPISEELGGEMCFLCDVMDDDNINAGRDLVAEKWGGVDILIHSVAFANREDLQGRFIDTSRDGFKLALDVSSYSLVALCKAYEDLLSDDASIQAMTYYGSEKVVGNYNIMGVAKAALEAGMRYLAADLGPRGVRVNCISAGPIKTMAGRGISKFNTILNVIEKTSPLRRNITQDEVGRTALFLASDLSAGITGQVIYVDCGYNIIGLHDPGE